MLGSTLLFSFVTDRQQKYMLAAMPIVFVPFVLNFTTGVMIYWITSNFWTIGQQGMIKRTMGHRFPQPVAKAGKGGSSGKGASTSKSGGKPKPGADGGKAAGGKPAGGKPKPGTDGGKPVDESGRDAPAAPWQRPPLVAAARPPLRPAPGRAQAVTEPAVRVEATGETVGEARWAALHELERRYPALDRDLVEYAVVSEGQRGLLGVGYEPARVVAVLAEEPASAAESPAAPVREPSGPAPDDSEAAGLVRELLGRVVHGLGIDADIEIEEAQGRVTGTVSGGDLGLLIGRHGQTIDAIQYLANAVVHRRQAESVEVVVDAEGYRERRERALCGVADRAVAEVAAHRPARGARADDLGRAQDRAPAPAGDGRGRHDQRGRRAQPARDRPPRGRFRRGVKRETPRFAAGGLSRPAGRGPGVGDLHPRP